MVIRVRFYSYYFGVFELRNADNGQQNPMEPITETDANVDDLAYAGEKDLKVIITKLLASKTSTGRFTRMS